MEELLAALRPARARIDLDRLAANYAAVAAHARLPLMPVVALSQLSRAPDQRAGDHRPQLSDLRESGAIEQDADLIMFLFREEVYAERENGVLKDPGVEGKAEVIIGKQRNGPTGTVKLAFIREFTRFENLEWRGGSQ